LSIAVAAILLGKLFVSAALTALILDDSAHRLALDLPPGMVTPRQG